MSHAASISHDHDHAGDSHAPYVVARSRLNLADVTLDGGGPRTLAVVLAIAGAAAMVVTALLGSGEHLHQAMAAYLIGFAVCVGLSLGSLGYCMIFQQFNAGWATAVRRPLEHMASLFPICLILFAPILILAMLKPGVLYHWMDPELQAGGAHFDALLAKKAGFLNFGFWAVRSLFYLLVWSALGIALYRLSRLQDETGDKWLTARARWISSFGLLIFALTTAFSSFDWLKSLDYHWFSTMFGVYFFAGNILSTTAVLVFTLAALKKAGKLKGVISDEHFHDLGKLMFSFTVFWAYITFSQYFLIWYANIPEETGWFTTRQQNGWLQVGFLMCVGQFAVPFLVLIFRPVKRSAGAMMFMAAWVFIMHIVDVFYIVRPSVHGHGENGGPLAPTGNLLLDGLGVLGPLLVFLGIYVYRLSCAPLAPIKDPRLHETLEHKNYV